MESLCADVLVVGGGLAGFRAAVAARQAGADVVVTYHAHGASPYVIGFNAPIGAEDPRDSPDVFFDDMIRGGYGLNDRRLVRVLAHGSIDAFNELAALGVPFAQRDGRTAQRHLSGNTYPRSVYIPDGTGGALLQALKRQARDLGVRTLSPYQVVELLKHDSAVVGAMLRRSNGQSLLSIRARATVLATGGIGRLFAGSTYPSDVAAEPLAMALEAGAGLLDMEFVQFEPVVTVWPEACRGMEMPTAMLGDGAQLRNVLGERFMLRVNPPHAERGIEKARMALYIQREIDEGRGLPEGGVIFDTTLLPPDRRESYVSHCSRLRRAGVDPATQAPVVAPAAHSLMGGIGIDAGGATGVPGLFAGGEAAGGLHGASRVAGNGCADTLVFGAVAGRTAAREQLSLGALAWPVIEAQAIARLDPERAPARELSREVKARIRGILAERAGIWRSGEGLDQGLGQLRGLMHELEVSRGAESVADAIEARQAQRMCLVACTIVNGALLRAESRGAHQRRDHPQPDDSRFLHHLTFRLTASGVLSAEATPIH